MHLQDNKDIVKRYTAKINEISYNSKEVFPFLNITKCNKIYRVRKLLHQTERDAFGFTNFTFELKFIISLRLIFFYKKIQMEMEIDLGGGWLGGGSGGGRCSLRGNCSPVTSDKCGVLKPNILSNG